MWKQCFLLDTIQNSPEIHKSCVLVLTCGQGGCAYINLLMLRLTCTAAIECTESFLIFA